MRILAVVVATLLTGCPSKKQEVQKIVDSPIAVSADVDSSTDFSWYQTWDWIPVTQIPGQDSWGTGDPALSKMILEAFESEMFTRGYKKVDSGYELIANFFLAVEDVDRAYLEEHYKGQFPQYKLDMGGKDKNVQWREGTLVLFLFDSKTGQLVWQATAQAEVTRDSTPEQREARIKKAAKLMLESLPKQG
jgi:hypothetical protein